MKNGEAKVFETEKAEFSAPKKLLEDGQEWAGLGILEDAIVGATDNAVVKVWERKEFEDNEDFEEIPKIESKTEQTIKSAGKVRAGKVRRKTMVIGGESTQLQMVDLENLDKVRILQIDFLIWSIILFKNSFMRSEPKQREA